MKVGELIAVLSVDMSQYDKDLAAAQSKAKTVGSTISDIFKNAVSFTLGMGLFNAIQSGFRAVVNSALDFNVMMENAKIGFATMLGSAQQAKSFLESLQDFADKTPFEFPQLQDSAKMLMAFGFEAKEVLPIMKAVGDAAAGLGGGSETINRLMFALGQMKTAGRVTAQDMMQLTSAGIPAWEILAEKMGKSVAEVRKLSEDGLIPASQAVNILIEGMEGRFKNLMKNMENTWQGITSTIKDTLRGIIGKATEGAFEGLKNWLKGVRDWLQQFKSEMEKGGLSNAIRKMFGSDVAKDILLIDSALKAVGNALTSFISFVKNNWGILRPLILGTVEALLAFKIASVAVNSATNAIKLFKAVVEGTNIGGKALSGVWAILSRTINYYKVQMSLAAASGITNISIFTKLRTVIMSLIRAVMTPQGLIVAAIAGVIIAGVLLYKNWDKVRYYGLQAWGALKIGIAYVAYAIVSYYKIILGWIPALGNAFSNMQKSLANYIAKEKSILAQRASAFNKDDNDVKSAQKLVDNQKKIADASKNAASGLNEQADATKKAGKATQDNLQSFDEVHQIMQETADASENMPEVELPSIEAPAVDMGGMSGALGEFANIGGITDSISNAFEKVKEKLAGFWDGVVDKWEAVKEKFKGFADTMHNLWSGIQEKWESFKNFVRDLWNGIIEKWNGFKQSLITNFRDWLHGLWDGIQTKWNGFKTFVKDFWDGVQEKWNGFKATAEIFKNWVVSLWDAAVGKWNSFKDLVHKLWDGVIDKWNGVKAGIDLFVNWVKSLWNDPTKIWNAFKTLVLGLWDGVVAAWNKVQAGINTFVKWVLDLWNNPTKVWSKFKELIHTLWNGVVEAWNKIQGGANVFVKWANVLWDGVNKKWAGFKDFIHKLWDGVVDKWNGFKKDIDKIVKWAEGLWENTEKSWADFKANILKFWDDIVKNIQKPFDTAWNNILSMPSKAYEWGKNLLDNIVRGIDAAIDKVKDAAKGAAQKIADFFPHSPAKEGPLSTADEWGPSLMNMLTQGIYSNISKVRNAAAEAAGVLSGITTQPEIAFGLSGGVTGNRAGIQSNVAAVPQPQVHLHIGTLIADDYGLKKLEQRLREIRIYEQQRLGADAQ